MFDNLSFVTSIFVRSVLFFVFRFRCFFLFFMLYFFASLICVCMSVAIELVYGI